MRRSTRVRLLPAVLLILALALPTTGMAATPAHNGQQLQTVIVGLELGNRLPERVAADLAGRLGGQTGFVYSHAFLGFSMELPERMIPVLERDPRIAFVEADQTVQALDIPTGVRRIEADQYHQQQSGGQPFTANVDVAIIDTGIADHPDLNIVGDIDCTSTFWGRARCYERGNSDGNGHGTHVAGTVGAKSDGGVVGVAPGARLWSVKVLNSNGSGSMSSIIAGIDWVTARAGTIEVANMSLGCECNSTALDTAINNSTNAGVVHVVSAGNSAKNAATFSPAKHPRVIAVSAVADFDGQSGGLGAPTCRADVDDTLADFSNFGSVVDIAAPGACITSTWPGGDYATLSGTSMASPHVAGAAALYILANNVPRNSSRWSTVLNGLKSDSWSVPQTHVCGFSAGLSAERSLMLADCSGTVAEPEDPPVDAAPTAVIVSPANGATVQGALTIQVDADDAEDSAGSLDVEVQIDGGAWQTAAYNTGNGFYELGWDTTAVADGSHAILARATDSNSATTLAAQAAVTVSNPVEAVNVPPTAQIVAPDSTVSGTVVVEVAAADTEDAAGTLAVQVSIAGGSWQPAVYDAGSNIYRLSWDTTSAANGVQTIDARATDSDGAVTNATQVSVTVDNAPPPVETSGEMHVAGLEGESQRYSTYYWGAVVTISVEDANGAVVPGATVTGVWSTGQSASCQTNSAGECSVRSPTMWIFTSSVGYEMEDVSHATFDYEPGDNVASSITVGRP